MNTRLKVSEAMDKDPLVEPGALTVLDAARRMRDHGVGSILVYDDGLKGIVTERDLLHKVVAEGIDPSSLRLTDVMSEDLVTVDLDADILQALTLMRQRRIRHLPVVQEGRLAGLVTERTISQVAPELLQIADDWAHITNGDGAPDGLTDILGNDILLPGRCEVCGNADNDLHESAGTLLCEECLETQETESTVS